MKRLLLLRPEPGLGRSADRARTLGLDPVLCPLFEIQPLPWTAPEPADYDGLLLTSANAVRYAGPQLGTLSALPVYAVGAATAKVAREAGLRVAATGEAGVEDLLANLDGRRRLLHLAGEHRHDPGGPHRIDSVPVYRSAAIPDPALPGLADLVIAVHSPRAGARLGELAGDRSRAAIAAISAAAGEACGNGWFQVAIASRPDDDSLLALAARLCHTSAPA